MAVKVILKDEDFERMNEFVEFVQSHSVAARVDVNGVVIESGVENVEFLVDQFFRS